MGIVGLEGSINYSRNKRGREKAKRGTEKRARERGKGVEKEEREG